MGEVPEAGPAPESGAEAAKRADGAAAGSAEAPQPPETQVLGVVGSPGEQVAAAEGEGRAGSAPGHGRAGDLSEQDREVVAGLPAGSAMLVLPQSPGGGQRFLLDEDKVTAGRHPRAGIFLDDVTVSRSHAEFIRQADRFVVRDAGSLNGIYVNHLRVDEAVLSDGDEVQLGKFRLVFRASLLDERTPPS